MDNILEVSGLRKSYRNFALKDVAFSLPEGCITGFIGVNGAGKTTTLRTLLRLTDKDAGQIQFFGLDMERNEKQIKDRLGIVLDDGCFYEELTLAEMKSIIAPAYTAWSERDFKQYMDMFSLDPKQKINTLSKGMRMKYALALALSHEAELLIMDEPTSGLDPLIRSQLLKILTDYMSKGGKGVFFSTHITSDLDKIADMLIMIDNGSIVFQEEKDTLLQYVSLKEYQCPKASALLCAAPFPRRLLVLSKYIFCLLIYAICCLIFGVETMVAPQLGTLHLDALALMFLITALVVGLYLPVQYKLGYEKTKFVFVVIIMASPVLTAALLKMEGMNFDALFTAPPVFVYGGMILAGIVFLIISACLSIKFYDKVDLA